MKTKRLTIEFSELMKELELNTIESVKGDISIGSISINGNLVTMDLKVDLQQDLKDEWEELAILNLLKKYKRYLLGELIMILSYNKYKIDLQLENIKDVLKGDNDD